MIKAILFDLGGTLVKGNDSKDIFRAYGRFLQSFGVKRKLVDIERAFKKVNKKPIIERILNQNKSFWVEFNFLFLRELNVGEKALELAKFIDREWWDNVDITIYSDVLPVLKELACRKLMLGIITNGVESDIDAILAKVSLKDIFELRVGIDTFKKIKPDKEVFLLGLNRMNLQPSEVLFIGDSLKNDYIGASKAGINALLIDRKNKIKQKGIRKIRNMREVFNYI